VFVSALPAVALPVARLDQQGQQGQQGQQKMWCWQSAAAAAQ